MVRKHILFSGRVQGVGFRYHSSVLARDCNLSGWVRNLGSGDVEMEIQGNPLDIDRFLHLIGKNDFHIRIDTMDVEDRKEIDEKGFSEKY
jgi:acylphosphatase